jgi:hypothetical protein
MAEFPRLHCPASKTVSIEKSKNVSLYFSYSKRSWAMPCGETESGDDTTNLQRVGSVASTPRIEPKLGLSGTVSTVVMQPTKTL